MKPVLTTQGNPPVATALPIAAPPVATAVVMTHFVVARGGPPVVEKFSPQNGFFSGKTTGIRSRIIKKQLELDLKLPKKPLE